MNIAERRDSIRANLSPIYLPFFDELLAALDSTGQIYWAPTQGARSLAQQAEIYSHGRTAPGPIVSNAKPGDSAHDFGCATDFAYFDPSFNAQQIFSLANWDTYKSVVESTQGLVWGGDFKSICDRPHNELALKISWGTIGQIYRLRDLQTAIQAIQDNLI